MKKINFIAMLAVVLTIFSACEKEVIQTTDQKIEENLCYDESVLEFNSQNEVKKLISEMKENDFTNYNEIKKRNNFSSLDDYNKLHIKSATNEEDIESEPEDSIVRDPFLIRLLDEKRSIIIDGYYYRITNNGMFRCTKDERSKLDEYLANSSITFNIDNPGEKDEFVEVSEGIELFLPKKIFAGDIDNYVPNNKLKSSNLDYAIMNECDEGTKTIAGDIIAGVVGYSVNCENNYSSNRRVKSVFWAQNWFFYSSVGIKVKMQRRRFGIWWAKDAQNLELGWDMIEYKINYDFNPDYLNLAISENVLNADFHNLGHFDKIMDILKNFKVETGSFPNSMTLHRELCKRNFKEWTIRNVRYYNNSFADIVWYLKNGDYDRIRNQVAGQGTKALLSWLKGELNSSWDPDDTNTFEDWNNLPVNKVMTLINEEMEVTRILLPQEGALVATNENKIEKILDYSEGVFAFGYSNKGGESFFNAKLYKAPSTFEIQNGSSIYGLAKYDNQWRGSRIVKRELK
jgi:hypothetical protein